MMNLYKKEGNNIMNNRVSEKRFRNSTFYKHVVPEDLRVFISKYDFYSHLGFIMTEANREKLPISTLQRKIVHARFIDDKTAQEIQTELSINSTTYNHEIKSLEVALTRYYETYVRPYPLRVVILKMRNLNHKRSIKEVYRAIPENKIKVITFINSFYDQYRGKEATGYHKIIEIRSDGEPFEFSEQNVVLLNKLYVLTAITCNSDSFLRYVTTKEKTKKTTVTSKITKIEDFITNSGIKITL